MRLYKLDAFNGLFSAVNDLVNYIFHPISVFPLIVAQCKISTMSFLPQEHGNKLWNESWLV